MSNYFKQAKSWSDDVYGAVEQSRNRYKVGFFASMALNGLALLAVSSLLPLKTLVPLMIHHYDNGITTVEPLENANKPKNKAQVEADIIRYITNRESYDMSAYRSQYSLVALLSNEAVLRQFNLEQDKSSKDSPVNLLGTTGYREVHVYSLNFIDNLVNNEKDLSKDHHNLAEVVFSLTDVDKASGHKTESHYNALLSWEYRQASASPDIRWKNWDGFVVTRYSRQIRNV